MASEHGHIWDVLGYKDGMVEWRCDGCSAHGFMQDHLIIYEFLRIAPLYQAAEQQLAQARALLEEVANSYDSYDDYSIEPFLDKISAFLADYKEPMNG